MFKILIACCALLLPGLAAAANPQVELKTSLGSVTLELYPAQAPKTVENFLQYVRSGQYNGTIFHRVIPGFMIQGGGFTTDFTEKPTRAPIPNEANNGLRNDIGTLAMARRDDPNSASAQFFINVANNDSLNAGVNGAGYAVFGKVIKGIEVVNNIAAVKTGYRPPYSDVPLTAVVIQSAKILEPAVTPVKQ